MFDAGPDPNELRTMSEGAAMAGMLPTLERQTEKIVREVENRVFAAIRAGSLTDEMAKLSWLEIYSHRMMLKKMQSQISFGKSIGEKYADVMKLGDYNG